MGGWADLWARGRVKGRMGGWVSGFVTMWIDASTDEVVKVMNSQT
jgi:hypothetical protein